jgi:predicted dehydrogenase
MTTANHRHRVGIIGCGGRAQQHAEALRHLPDVEIAGATDLDADRLGAFCDRWEIENRYLTSTALLESQRLDLATIVTLPAPHLALVTECTAAGVPYINIEKPFAYTLAEAGTMLAACEAAGSLLTVNQQMRFLPQFVAVRDLVASGRLGELRSMRVGSKGHLTEQGPHVMDQMLFMNDETPALWVMGQADGAEGYDLKHAAPGTTIGSIRFANGVDGTLICGVLAPNVDPSGNFWLNKHIEVTGTRGWAGAYVNNGWRAYLDTGEVLSGPGTWNPNWPAQAELFRTGLRWIEDRSVMHPCRAEVALRGLEALLAVCESAIDRRAVTLPLNRERDPLSELRPLLSTGLGA